MWKCKRCGKCCKFFRVNVGPQDEETLEYLDMHGIVKEGSKLLIPARCKHLNCDNTCNIYDERPEVCRNTGEYQCREAKRQYAKIEDAR